MAARITWYTADCLIPNSTKPSKALLDVSKNISTFICETSMLLISCFMSSKRPGSFSLNFCNITEPCLLFYLLNSPWFSPPISAIIAHQSAFLEDTCLSPEHAPLLAILSVLNANSTVQPEKNGTWMWTNILLVKSFYFAPCAEKNSTLWKLQYLSI